jgi:hypothetical protein
MNQPLGDDLQSPGISLFPALAVCYHTLQYRIVFSPSPHGLLRIAGNHRGWWSLAVASLRSPSRCPIPRFPRFIFPAVISHLRTCPKVCCWPDFGPVTWKELGMASLQHLDSLSMKCLNFSSPAMQPADLVCVGSRPRQYVDRVEASITPESAP